MPSKIKKQRPGRLRAGPQKPQNEREVLVTTSAIRCRETLDRIWKPGEHAMANNGLVGNLSSIGKIVVKRVNFLPIDKYFCAQSDKKFEAMMSKRKSDSINPGSLFYLIGG